MPPNGNVNIAKTKLVNVKKRKLDTGRDVIIKRAKKKSDIYQ